MQIISVDASHGGATHDSFIWANHPLKAHLEDLSSRENIWFLGMLLVLYKDGNETSYLASLSP